MYYILYLEALSGGPSWVFSINQSINPQTLSQSPHGTSPPKLTSPMSVSKVQNPHKDPPSYYLYTRSVFFIKAHYCR